MKPFTSTAAAKVAEHLHEHGEASESFSAMDWDWEQREVVVLALVPGEPHICGAMLMQRMFGTGGTGKLKMRLSDAVLFEEPIEPRNMQDVASLSALQLKLMTAPNALDRRRRRSLPFRVRLQPTGGCTTREIRRQPATL